MSSAVLDLAPSGSRSDLRAGIRAMAPMMLAYVPFALVVGAAVASSANPWAAWLATWTIYGGAAHLAVLGVLAQGSGWAAAAAVGLLVNARLAAYATAMAPQWRSAPRGQRALAALMLTDVRVGAGPGPAARAAAVLPRCRRHPLRRLAGPGHGRRGGRAAGDWPSR